MPSTTPDQRLVTPEWVTSIFPAPTGGLNVSQPAHRIDESQSPNSKNVVVRHGEVVVDSGYAELGSDVFGSGQMAVFGVARKAFTHVDNANTNTLLLITDETVYKLGANSDWLLIPRGDTTADDTTISVALTGGETTITLAAGEGGNFAAGMICAVVNNAGQMSVRKIDSVAGSPVVVTLTFALPVTFVADIGNQCFVGANLSGVNTENVVCIPWPGAEATVILNGIDVPQRYVAGTNIVDDVPGLSTTKPAGVTLNTARTGGLYRDHLVLGNVKQGGTWFPNRVVWCDTGDYTAWNSGNAGYRDLLDVRDSVIAMEPFSSEMIIYRTRSIVRQEYVGTTALLFNFRTMVAGISVGGGGIGALSPNSVYNVGNYHLVMGKDGVYRYQGGISSVHASQGVFRRIFSAQGDMNKGIAFRSFVQYVDEYNEVFFFYPSTEATTWCDRAIVLNIEEQAWSHRHFTREFSGSGGKVGIASPTYNDLVGMMIEQTWTATSRTMTGETPTIVLCNELTSVLGLTYEYDYISGDETGTSIEWYIETSLKEFIHAVKRISTFHFFLGGVSITISYSTDGGASWVSLGTFSPGAVPTQVVAHCQLVARSIMIRFSGTGGGPKIGEWAMQSRPEGKWGL